MFDFLEFFGSQMVKTRSNLYLNDQIHVQTIKFEFKRTNQKLTAHYHPPTPEPGGSTGSSARTLPPSLTPVRTVPSDLSIHYPYHLVPLPRVFPDEQYRRATKQ
jgi:hypothetical protein